MNQKSLQKKVLKELAGIAFANPADYLAIRDGQLEIRSTDTLTRRQQAAVASIERATGGIRLKFYDKLKALELLGKYLGLFDGSGDTDARDNGLLEAILRATQQEVSTNEIPEIQ